MEERVDACSLVSHTSKAYITLAQSPPSGERFRTHRRFIHQTFNKRAVGALTPLQQSEAQTLIEGITSSPDAFREHIRRLVPPQSEMSDGLTVHRYAAATILKVTYGAQVTSIDDPYVQLGARSHRRCNVRVLIGLVAERAGTLTIQSGTPANSLVDYFPMLRYVCEHVVLWGN